MAYQGLKLEDEVTVEKMRELIYEYGGNITSIAKHLHYGRNTIYDFIDINTELNEDLAKSRCRIGEYEVESGYNVIDRLMSKVEEDPANAFKAANLALTRSKHSRYYTDKETSSTASDNEERECKERVAKKIQESKRDAR